LFSPLFAASAALGAEAAVVKNRPPLITGSSPRDYFRIDPEEIRWGKELRFQVGVNDPDGDALKTHMEAGQDVEGATFDASERVFRWTPTQAQKGAHEIRFVVSDGALSESRMARLLVVDNRAPTFQAGRERVQGNSDADLAIELAATDRDGDSLVYQIADLPSGAKLEGSVVRWRPREAQIGSHLMHVSVSDGEASASRELEVLVEDEWSTAFLPGVYYSLWAPTAHGDTGLFHGAAMEVVPYAWIHRNANRGPSHGRLTIRADLLDSTHGDVGLALIYALGIDLSIERNPYRRWLIPFFGVDAGGVTQRKLGHHFQSSPHLGLYLWTSRNVFVTVSGAYQIVPDRLDTLSGWRASLGANLTLW
jgi:hypothetical protein